MEQYLFCSLEKGLPTPESFVVADDKNSRETSNMLKLSVVDAGVFG